MFQTTLVIDGAEFAPGKLGHLDFDKPQLIAFKVQQLFLQGKGLDIDSLLGEGYSFWIPEIEKIKLPQQLFPGDEVAATIQLRCERSFRLYFKIILEKNGKLAFEATFLMILTKSGKPVRLPPEFEAMLLSETAS